MSDQLTQAQDAIVDGLNAANWQEVQETFGQSTVDEIKAELNIMFWSDTGINHKFAQEIYDELN